MSWSPGRQGAKPTPQLPITAVVTPCQDVGRELRAPARLTVIVGVDVDEAGGDDLALGVDLRRASAQFPDRGDPPVLYRDIGLAGGAPVPSMTAPLRMTRSKHGPRIGRGLSAGLCSQPKQAIASGGPTFAETASLLAAEAARRSRAQPLRRLAHGAVSRHRRAGE